MNDTGTDAFLEIGSKATKSTVGTACISTSPVTGEESTQYISSLLETTKSVLVDKGGTTTQVRNFH